MSKPIIRPVAKDDNVEIAAVVRKVLMDLGAPKVGTAYADVTLDRMFETYKKTSKATYLVVEIDGEVVGGAGIAQLENYDGPVCELQKMYFLDQARGKGIGSAMMKRCLDEARFLGFKQCYLETMPYMEAAQKLYKRTGFYNLDGPMGDTGHYSCTVHMLIDL